MRYEVSVDRDSNTITATRNGYWVTAPIEGVNAWAAGELIQNALPRLTRAECEFLITGMTPLDWKKTFPETENGKDEGREND
jgi:hypothetical protein